MFKELQKQYGEYVNDEFSTTSPNYKPNRNKLYF